MKKKGFVINPARAGSLLSISSDFNTNFDLSMDYSFPDLKTNQAEHKSLFMSRQNKADGKIDLEMKWAGEGSTIAHKIEISHSEFLIIKRLIEVAYSSPVLYPSYHGLERS